MFGSQQDAPEVLNQILDTIYPENSISPFCVTLIESTYCSNLPCEHKIDQRESHQTLPIEVVDTEQQSIQGLLNVKLQTHYELEGYRCDGCGNVNTSKK